MSDQHHRTLLILEGHIIDSMILPQVMDLVMDLGGNFTIEELRVGQHKDDISRCRMEVVAPDAEVKIYLNADSGTRERRRQAERPDIGGDALATDLRLRDESDAIRMQPAPDAERIDTTELEVDDVVTRIEQLVHERLAASRR